MAMLDLFEYFFVASEYDTVTGYLTLELPTGLTHEQVILLILENIEAKAQNKRNNIDFPICEKSFPDNPNVTIVNRTNSDNSQSENQIERLFQFVGMYKLNTPTYVNAVNDDD
jgi:hypothetical protein